jgi:MFS family permease
MAQARSNPWLVLVVLTMGFFMILLDTTIVNVAIPAMSGSANDGLNTTLDQILWILNAYILVYAVLLITAGRLGDLYGQRNLFAIGLFVFTFASALCGLSQNATELILARILQGVGGAMLTPQTLAILTTRSRPSDAAPRSVCGARSAAWRPSRGRPSAARSSPTSTGAGSFSSTCPSASLP